MAARYHTTEIAQMVQSHLKGVPAPTQGSRRILLFSTQITWGGGEEQLRLLAEGLVASDWRVLTVAPAQSRLAQYLEEAAQTVQMLRGRGRGPRNWWQIRRTLRDFRPHVLWMNDPHAILHGLVAAIGLRLIRVGARRTIFPLRSGRLYRWGLHCVVCPSRASAAACQAAGIPQSRIAVIHDGVDPKRLATANKQRGREKLRNLLNLSPAVDSAVFVVHVGKLTPAKGQEDLLEAFADLAAEFPQSFLVLVGEGEQRPVLEARIHSLGLDSRAVLAGFREDALELMAGADLFVFPSRQEGLGGAVMEALFLGLPVIASTAGGIPELFEGLEDISSVVRLVQPGDVPALREALAQLLRLEPRLRHRWGELAGAYAREHFTASRMVEQTAALLDRLVTGNAH
ncbi:glycosyltransferase [Thermogutta sp.]|uniref:glycosyltransferase n=1 Tax=Thermogutta sp. TaxID=1962930 RepID=UPI00321F72C5